MNEITHLVEQLKRVEHFKRLSQEDLVAIVNSGQVRNYKSEQVLFMEGETCAGMHVLLTGEINLCKIGPEGQVSILNSIVPVMMFNEVPVLDGGVNPVTAIAKENSKVWFVNCDRFQWLITRFPQLAIGLLRVLAHRNRIMINNYGDLSFRSVTSRIAKYLLDHSDHGEKVIKRVDHPIKNIAARVVTTPEAVSRTLKMISNQNIIIVDRACIRILDRESLSFIAQIYAE